MFSTPQSSPMSSDTESEASNSSQIQHDYLTSVISIFDVPIEGFRHDEYIEVSREVFGMSHDHPDIACHHSDIRLYPGRNTLELSVRITAFWYEGPGPFPSRVTPTFAESVKKVLNVLMRKYPGKPFLVVGSVESGSLLGGRSDVLTWHVLEDSRMVTKEMSIV